MSPELDELRRTRNAHMDRLRRRRNALARLNGVETSMVPAAPIRSHLKTLHGMGWSFEAIAAIHGCGTAAGLRLIAHGNSLRAERKFESVAQIPVTLAVPDCVGDSMWVPSLGATRRVRALMAYGWRHEDMAELAGRSLHRFAHEGSGKTRAVDWRIIDRIFDRLATTPGGSDKSSTRARNLGYQLPLAWRDIDDPTERPSLERDRIWGAGNWNEAVDQAVVWRVINERTRPRKLTRAESEEIARILLSRGVSTHSIENDYGINLSRQGAA